MYLQKNKFRFSPAVFGSSVTNGAGDCNLCGTTQKTAIDPTYPIEDLKLVVSFTVGAALTTYVTGTTYTSNTQTTTAQTPDQYEGPLQILQHINLSINDGVRPRSVFDGSGITYLEYADWNGVALDSASALFIALAQGTPIPVGNYRLTYRLPCVETWMGEPLRSRCLLPVHRYPQQPVLSLTFQSAANMYSAGHITAIYVDVVLNRRVPTPQSELRLAADAKALGLSNPTGYIDFDLNETVFNPALGTGNQSVFNLPLTGSYLNMFFRHYLGGANVTRREIDFGATGSSFGNENVWVLQSGGVNFVTFKWRDLQIEGEYSQPRESLLITPSSGTAYATQGYPGGNVPGVVTPGASQNYFRPATSVGINFLNEEVSGDNCTELGSVISADLRTGINLSIIGNATSVATNASALYFMGRRLFGNLAGLQVFGNSLRD